MLQYARGCQRLYVVTGRVSQSLLLPQGKEEYYENTHGELGWCEIWAMARIYYLSCLHSLFTADSGFLAVTNLAPFYLSFP